MQSTLTFSRAHFKSVLIDFTALVFIYFVPSLSHLFNIPLYFIEPMRIMLVIAMVHTSRNNAYLLALTLPLFSFLVSSHPNIYKGMIMTIELVINVWLFFEISKRVANTFAAMLSSIIISKIIYYLLKFGLIRFAIIESGLFSTSVGLQLILAIVLSGYLFLFYRQVKTE